MPSARMKYEPTNNNSSPVTNKPAELTPKTKICNLFGCCFFGCAELDIADKNSASKARPYGHECGM